MLVWIQMRGPSAGQQSVGQSAVKALQHKGLGRSFGQAACLVPVVGVGGVTA